MSATSKWVSPAFSRGEVDRAGKVLAESDGSGALLSDPVAEVFNNWRSSHSFPLNTLQMSLRNKAMAVYPTPIVAQRLKRVPSIIQKLRRFQRMKLSRMQDVGGARAVLPTVAHVDKLRQLFAHGRARHTLANEKDYIREPKASGYRGIHLVYRYHSDKNDSYNGLQIELQLRTRTQHAWATAVETVGTFLGESLKSSQGSEKWLRFFQLIGSGFAMGEGGPLADNVPDDPERLLTDVREAAEQLKVESTLTKFRTTLEVVWQADLVGIKYVLLVLQPKDPGLRIFAFRELAHAADRYLIEEQRLANTSGDAVLVRSNSLDSLRRAFPNYFADSRRFIQEMDRLLHRH